ncbi:MAG: hypothetical protein RMJ30_04320 [Nitrososphaerota archaeon]|nr:hypothetical protein [Nitrososphaerota archaeon]
MIVRSGGGQIGSIMISIKSAVGKHPVDMRAGKLVIGCRDPYDFNPNIYITNSNDPTTGVRVRQMTGSGDTALEYAEL